MKVCETKDMRFMKKHEVTERRLVLADVLKTPKIRQGLVKQKKAPTKEMPFDASRFQDFFCAGQLHSAEVMDIK